MLQTLAVHVVQKDELGSDDTCLSKSLNNVKVPVCVDHKVYTPGMEQVFSSGQPPGEWDVQQEVLATVGRPRLSSVYSGEFLPPAEQSPPRVDPHEQSAEKHDSLAVHVSALSHSQLQSLSEEQVLRMLSQQQDDICHRESELSNLNSGIQFNGAPCIAQLTQIERPPIGYYTHNFDDRAFC